MGDLMERKVLIADDDRDMRLSLKGFLQDLYGNVSVDEAASGKELVELARKGDYAIILTDNYMPPGITGVEAVKAIREFNRGVPIYVLSGHDVREEALAAGATGYLHKLVSVEKLPDILAFYLS